MVDSGRLLMFVFLALVAPAVIAQVDESAPDPPPVSVTGYDDDYSYLRDPKNRSGVWWESLKFIPIDEDGRVYLTLGDEARMRFDVYENNRFGDSEFESEDYYRYRHMPSIGLTLGPNVRLFGQGLIAYGAQDADNTRGDVLQATALVRLPLGAAGDLTLQGGRQMLQYGSGRMINTGPNIRLALDGGMVRWKRNALNMDAFYMRPVLRGPAWFDHVADDQRRLWSLYGTFMFREAPASGLDFFYIGYENEMAAFNPGEGHEQRHTFGSRFFMSRGPWHIDLEGHLQTGSFDDGDLRAWGVQFQGRYTLWGHRFNPWLGTRLTALSGDGDPEDADLNTYNALFPRGSYHGEVGVMGPGNVLAGHQTIGLDFGSGFTGSLTGILFWRQSLGDGIYGMNGSLIRPDGGSNARFIGTQGEVTLDWELSRHFSLHLMAGALEPGQYIEDTGSDHTVFFFTTHIEYRF